MSIVRWNPKEAGCGEPTNPRANPWPDEQKPHTRLCMRVRLQFKPKPDNYTESCMVNAAGGWGEKKRVVPGEVCAACPEKDNHCRETVLNAQKSAEAIVAEM